MQIPLFRLSIALRINTRAFPHTVEGNQGSQLNADFGKCEGLAAFLPFNTKDNVRMYVVQCGSLDIRFRILFGIWILKYLYILCLLSVRVTYRTKGRSSMRFKGVKGEQNRKIMKETSL